MKLSMHRPFQPVAVLFLAAAMGLTAGCAALDVKKYDAPATRELVERIAGRNSGLKGFKGIGDLRFRPAEGAAATSARVAWMGLYPGRLRIEVMSAGQPMAKLAVDGRWFYLISHSEDRFYKTESANPSLKRLVGVPVRANDMIALLSGRIPLAPFHYADVQKKDGQWQLVLKHWGRTVQRLYLDGEGKRVRAIERFSAHEAFRYEATIGDVREVGGYAIPFRLDFTGDDGAAFSLTVDRYWADATVDPSRFSLLPSEPAGSGTR